MVRGMLTLICGQSFPRRRRKEKKYTVIEATLIEKINKRLINFVSLLSYGKRLHF